MFCTVAKAGGSFLICALLFACSPAVALESGQAIPAGTPDGRGPLATHAVSSEPLGVAHVFGGAEPDLFVGTGRHGRRQGLFLYKWTGRGADGAPVFELAGAVAHPFGEGHPPHGFLFQSGDGLVQGVWPAGREVVHTVFDRDEMRFEERKRIRVPGLPGGARSVAVLPNPNGGMELLVEVGDGVSYRPEGPSWRAADYDPFDGRGIWRGDLPYVGLYAATLPEGFSGKAEAARLVSTTPREVRFLYGGIAVMDLGEGHGRGILTGSRMGGLHYYRNLAATGIDLAPRVHAVGEQFIAHRHPTISPAPVAYPSPETGLSDVVAGGEGGLYWYRFSGRFTDEGKPVYADPVAVLEEDAALYAGSLPVVNCADWDGDGDQDLIAGNSEGFILFFENAGDSAAPRFLPGVRLEAGGHVIHVQPGYRGSIQGPSEARWGYVCPTVADWNQDGLPDIVMSDSTARHTVFLNEGTARAPKLAAGAPIYYDGLDLFGTWRVQPAVGRMGERMGYIALDGDDDLHLYWQVDARNVTDGGKLHDGDGNILHGNVLDAGGTGRLKLVLADWDQDGLQDLLVGTSRYTSIPNAWSGLPQILGRPGAAVLFLENVGTAAEPVFAYPKLFAYEGRPLYFGGHACSPAPADFGGPGGLGLVIGEESGRFLFYQRGDLTLYAPDFRSLGGAVRTVVEAATAK